MNTFRCWLAAMLILGTSGIAGADDSWVGQKVMERKPDVKFGVNGEDGLKNFPLEDVVWKVLKEKDGWLRFRGADGKDGWALKEEFVLLVDAPGFYTGLIKADEKSDWAWTQRGLAWSEKGEFDNAIKDYTEATRSERCSGA